MIYKLNPNVFFKKVKDDEVNVLLVDDDNFIYKIDKVAARVFLMIVEEKLTTDLVEKKVVQITGKKNDEVDAFLKTFYKKMLELNFLVKS